MEFVNAIANNFIGYDTVIIVMAIVNFAVYMATKYKLKILDRLIHKPIDMSLGRRGEERVVRRNFDDLSKVKRARIKVNQWYSLFANIISIFPLLGLLGTVISLIFTASDGSLEATQHYFMMSLTSTFWGMIFAIAYKIVDAFISPDVERLNNDAERLVVKQDN
jgi:chemotaxis protein MotA